uniref:Zer-1-like leucine-rich repeats region domain-containing protein n=1 Tax=Trypanosoma congolense (strain IL3000) TaxID=1068625 RepID=G0USA5_TRYCI|nr:conserved hypothetical protein [Trypanosoma congolense IL3000]
MNKRAKSRHRQWQEERKSDMAVAGKRLGTQGRPTVTTTVMQKSTQQLAKAPISVNGNSDGPGDPEIPRVMDSWMREERVQVPNPLSPGNAGIQQEIKCTHVVPMKHHNTSVATPENSECSSEHVNSLPRTYLNNREVAIIKGQMDITPAVAGNKVVKHMEGYRDGKPDTNGQSHVSGAEKPPSLDGQRRLSSRKKVFGSFVTSEEEDPTMELVTADNILGVLPNQCKNAVDAANEINKKTMEVLDQVRSSLLAPLLSNDNVKTDGPAKANETPIPDAGIVKPISSHSLHSTKCRAEVMTSSADDDCNLMEEEAHALKRYLSVQNLDLSMSTLKHIGISLRASKTLRVLNLKGCTASEEDLRGLSEIESLEVLCVSHMRKLTSLSVLTYRHNGRTPNIREIDARCSAVRNTGLRGLGGLKYLQKLNLSLTPVTDVTPLASSKSLSELNLSGTAVMSEGLVGLEKIPSLTVLNLSRTKIKSLQKLTASKTLENLILYSCQVDTGDVHGVESMPRLKSLDVSTTKVTDLSFLCASNSLKVLRAQWLLLDNCEGFYETRFSKRRTAASESRMFDVPSPISVDDDDDTCEEDGELVDRDIEASVRGLAKIPTLEFVDLSYSSVSSVRSLFSSKSIQTIVLRRTTVDDDGIKDVGQLRTLRTLVINNLGDLISSGGGEEDVVGTRGVLVSVKDITLAVNMVILDLSFTDVYDLRMLSSLKSLKELYLVETLITVDGIQGLEQLPHLRLLDISQTSITSLQLLSEGCKSLEQLFVKSNRNVSGINIGNIQHLPLLKELDISDTVVENIGPLFRQTCSLSKLVCRWGERRLASGVTEPLQPWLAPRLLDNLHVLPFLTTVDFTNASLHSVTFLVGCPALRVATLARCTGLSNNGISGLVKVHTLEVLDLSYASHITDVRSLVPSSSLKELRLAGTAVTVVGLQGTSHMQSLKLLDVTGTPAAETLSTGAAEEGRLVIIKDGEACNTCLPSRFRRARAKPVVILS